MTWQHGAPPPDLDEADLRRALESILADLGHAGAALSVLFADDARLQALNEAYRGLARPTDVLSWAYDVGDAGALLGEDAALLGELALSLQRAAAQATENGWSLRTEVLRLLVHGCAHVAGYDHETDAQEREMKALEVRLLTELGLPGLYPEDNSAR